MQEDQQGEESPDIGELNEESVDADEGAHQESEEGEQLEEQAEKKGRSVEDRMDVLKEEFGYADDELIVGKDGKIKAVEKINGKKYLVEPSQYRKGFGLNQASYQRLNEAKQLIKEQEAFAAAAKEDPRKLWELADKLGINKEELAESLLKEKLQEMDLSPEERERQEWEKKYKDKEKENEELKSVEQQRHFEVEKNKSMQKYDHELTTAMKAQGFSEAPKETKSQVLFTAINKLMLANQSNRELSAEDAVYLAKQEWQEQVLGYFDEIDENHITKIVPERIIKAIRKADLQRLKGGTPTANIKPDAANRQVELEEYEPKARKKQSITDYFSNLK